MIRSYHRIHKLSVCESDDANASERQVTQLRIDVKAWLSMKPVEQYMAIYRAARQNDANLKNRHKKSLQALECE